MSMNYDPEVIQYTLQVGDSIWDLADEFNITAEEIVAANPGIDPNHLYAGQVISIPDESVNAQQFRRFGGFGRPFRPFGFRRFRPFFRGPFIVPVPYPYYPCSPYDPYCPYDY
jgi:LysM repeat protein